MRLHDAGPAAGHDAGAAVAAIEAGAADHPAEPARDVVVAADLGQAARGHELLLRVGIARAGCGGGRGVVEPATGRLRLGHAASR